MEPTGAVMGTAKWIRWLETHWVAPAYIGWVLIALALFFFAAATNTLAGWLYVMSGILLALLALSAVLVPRSLADVQIARQPMVPVSVGEVLGVTLTVTNASYQTKGLFQIMDSVPSALGEPCRTAINRLGPGQRQQWQYTLRPAHRGVYVWENVTLRSAAPLGLFWGQRQRQAKAVVTVYPQILSLQRCPLAEAPASSAWLDWQHQRTTTAASEGLTRALRPYRWGDPLRLIHWRTSARYGDLRVRELEQVTTGRQIALALDTTAPWLPEYFEQAVVAAASLYIYALKQGFAVTLWLPRQPAIGDRTGVLTALARVQPEPEGRADSLPKAALWLTAGRQPALGQGGFYWPTSQAQADRADGAATWVAIRPALALAPQLERVSGQPT